MASTDQLEHEEPGLDESIVVTDRRPARRFRRSGARVVRRQMPITEGSTGRATSLRDGHYRWMLRGVDAAVAAAIVLLVLPATTAGVEPSMALVAALLMVLLNTLSRLYERDLLVLNRTTLDEAPSLLQAAAMFTLLLWIVHDAATLVTLYAGDAAVVWMATFALLLGGRALGRALVLRATPGERCLIVGENASITAIRQKIEDTSVNAEVVATLPVSPFTSLVGDALADEFRLQVRLHDVDRAIIAPASGEDVTDTLDLIRAAKHAGVRVSLVPRMLEVVGSTVEFDQIDGLTMLCVRRFGLSRSSRLLKRGFDLAGASVMLAVAAPTMLAIMAAIRLESHGPVFFRQTRVGKDGHRFKMLKFRSMIEGADAKKEALRALNETQGLFKIESDPRITRVGRFLRRTSLDELPQLVNVWRGEMSLVGPRPLVVDEDAKVQGFYRHRLHLTPGMTGHWQILGSARVPMHEMVSIDYLYVANWSLWTDVKILLRTIPYMLASRGM
ncbi:MAG TPA: sugar transferase [Candidatus Limnocylindrales bacterium]|nr:sugar transferase [Candidatus Limnocylindrales bacterium]